MGRLPRPRTWGVGAPTVSITPDGPVALAGQMHTVVAIAVPLTSLTRGMIGAKEFGMMKRRTILNNVSRGAVVEG